MFQPHSTFKEPDDPEVCIRRYLTLGKFISLLVKGALFFCSLEILQKNDPYEGALPGGNVRKRKAITNRDIIESYTEFDKINDYANKFHGISCWHMGKAESTAMWRLYLSNGEGVAIQSTYNRLRNSFITRFDTPTGLDDEPLPIYIGTVEYVDHDEDTINEDHPFYRVLHKDVSFRYENEIRAVAWTLPGGIASGNPMKTTFFQDNGLYIPIDLEVLIEQVMLPPTCPPWVVEVVDSLLKRYEVNVPLVHSRLKIPLR
jgi:hypothetical protein